jgi:hypothetical protein
MLIVHTETNSKIWIGAAAVGLTLVYFTMTSAQRLSAKPANLDTRGSSFSYEMPKGAEAEPQFDLSDRQVIRHSKADSLGEPVVKPQGPFNWVKTPTKMPVAIKKPMDAKKLEAQKKQQALQAQKQKLKQAVAKKEAARRAQLQVRTNAYNEKLKATRLQSSPTTQDFSPTKALAFYSPPADSNLDDGPDDVTGTGKKETEDLSLSPSAWRALLQVQPTDANAQKFLRALQKGKIDRKFYFQVTQELLKDSAQDRKKLGMQLVRANASADAFEFIVKRKSVLPADVQAQLETEQNRYSSAGLLSTLVKVTATSNDAMTLKAALGQLQVAIENFKRSQVQVQGTGKKDPSIPTLAQLSQFNAGLTRVAKNTDPEIAKSATDLSALLTEIKK